MLRLRWIQCLIVLTLAVGCRGVKEGPYYSATAQARYPRDERLTDAERRIAAVQLAEKRARDHILQYILDRTFQNGITLDDAAMVDPFLQAKVYDTLRNATITDQTINPEGLVTITVRLDMGAVLDIVNNAEYAERIARRVPRMAPSEPRAEASPTGPGEDRAAP